jgi:hypothetical protein
MPIKIKRPDGSEVPLRGKTSLDPGIVQRVGSSFSKRVEDIAKQAKDVHKKRQDNLELIDDESLRSSVAGKDLLA